MPANFRPEMSVIKDLKPFKFWCSKVLPSVYDDSLSYYELLTKVLRYLNDTMESVETLDGNVNNIYNAYLLLEDYVNNYFDNADFQQMVNDKLDAMAEDGTLTTLITTYVDPLFDQMTEDLDTAIENQNTLIDTAFENQNTLIDGRFNTQDTKLGVMESQMNEFIADHAGPAMAFTLWSGYADAVGTNITLSDDPANYDYIEVYLRTVGSSYCPSIHRFPADSFHSTPNLSVVQTEIGNNTNDTRLFVYRINIESTDSVDATKYRIRYSNEWLWTGTTDSDAANYENNISDVQEASAGIVKIVGIKNVQNNAEVIDARIGYDNTQYTTLGKAIRTQVGDLNGDFNELDSTLMLHNYSVNRYNSDLVTADTVSDNKQLASTGALVNNNNVCVTPFMEIEPNTVYTCGLVPAWGSAKAPWYNLPTAIVFYDDTYTYCGRVDGTNDIVTFTTPVDAKYYRFNILKSSISLNIIAVRTMLVYGDSLPSSFSSYTGDFSEPKVQVPVTYSIDNTGIATIVSKYGSGIISVEFGKRGPNNLPDFRYITANGRQKYNNSTDWFGPFVLEALSNIDGDDPTNSTYTGGNHNYNNTGTMDSSATARNLYLRYYADGKLLSNGESGTCSNFEIKWCNRVQAFNTRKADGTGREVLEERHRMNFNGYEWETYVEIQALEDLFCRQYYGFQCAVTQYPTIYMIGATYRKPFNYANPHDSGNNTPNIYTAHDSNDRLEMEVDRSVDLGKGILYGATGTQGFRTAGSKGYTYFISQKNLDANDVYGARGWYRFIPQP